MISSYSCSQEPEKHSFNNVRCLEIQDEAQYFYESSGFQIPQDAQIIADFIGKGNIILFLIQQPGISQLIWKDHPGKLNGKEAKFLIVSVPKLLYFNGKKAILILQIFAISLSLAVHDRISVTGD
jgi:hypothetical protein